MQSVVFHWHRLRPLDLFMLQQIGAMPPDGQYKALLCICDNLVDGGVSSLPIEMAMHVIARFGREAPAAIATLMTRSVPTDLPDLMSYTAQPRADPHCYN